MHFLHFFCVFLSCLWRLVNGSLVMFLLFLCCILLQIRLHAFFLHFVFPSGVGRSSFSGSRGVCEVMTPFILPLLRAPPIFTFHFAFLMKHS